MTSSIAHIPRGSIPYTQHWNRETPGFSRITGAACPGTLDNFSRYYGALSAIIDTTYNNYVNNLFTTSFTNPITVDPLSVTRHLTVEEGAAGILFFNPDALQRISLHDHEAPELVAQLQTQFTAGLFDGFSYNLTIFNQNGANDLEFSYTNEGGVELTDTIDPLTSATYTVVIKKVSPAKLYVFRNTVE